MHTALEGEARDNKEVLELRRIGRVPTPAIALAGRSGLFSLLQFIGWSTSIV